MGNCTKPQNKKKLKEQVKVVKKHFGFQQLQVLNRLNPTQVARLYERFTEHKVGLGYRVQRLPLLYRKLALLPETYSKNLFAVLDLTKDGVVCFTDFCIGVARVALAGEQERLQFLFDFLNIRAKEAISPLELLDCATAGAVRLKPGAEEAIRSSRENYTFARFQKQADRLIDVDESMEFCTFLPTASQQRIEVTAMLEAEGRPQVDTRWFIISSSWVQAWERYVQFSHSLTRTHRSLSPLDQNDIPTAIDNTALCSAEEPLLIAAEREEFIEVSEKLWNYWAELYGGGPPLPRDVFLNSDGVAEVDVYPCLVVCYEAEEFTYDVKNAKKVLVSQLHAGKSLHTVISSLLHRPPDSIRTYLRKNKRWEKTSPELTADTVKASTKCLVLPHNNPLASHGTLRKTKSQAVMSELKTSRILSQWDSEGAESPRSAGAERVVSSAAPLPWKGIPNMGNTCYMNCVLQCLCYTPLFGNFFLNRGFSLALNTSSQTSLSNAISTIFSAMTGHIQGVPDPSKVHRFLGEQSDLFRGHEENDSYECLVTLLDRLHEELKRGNTKIVLSSSLTSPTPAGLEEEISKLWSELHGDFGSPVSDLFSGLTKTTVACGNCNNSTVTLTPTFSLDLQMPQQETVHLMVTVVPLSGEVVTVGLTYAANQTVEAMIKQVKGILGVELQNVVLFSWAYSGVYTVYSPESKLQEVVHDTSVSLYAQEMPVGYKPDREEAAPTPGEASPTVSTQRLLKLVHRFHITQANFQERDYFPEVVMIPEKITYAALLATAKECTKRFRNEQISPERMRHNAYFVNFSNKMCGKCDKWYCLGCGVVPSEDTVDWGKLKDKFVIWVKWEEPDGFKLQKTMHQSATELAARRVKGIGIEDCLDAFSHAEQLSAHCSTCKSELTSKIELVKLPDILVITFCRFRISDSLPVKSNYLVHFPLSSLNMGKWVSHSDAKPGSCTILTTPLQYIYDLFAVVDHIGNARSGEV